MPTASSTARYDNASGVSGLLLIAQSMARAASRPERSMYFVFTTAEESGLLGAEHFAQHPVIPMDQRRSQHQR